jgi:hypothetical protein
MTLTATTENSYTLYCNIPDLTGDNYSLSIRSLYSRDHLILNALLVLVDSNSRYTKFIFENTLDLDEDLDGVYEVTVLSGEVLIDRAMIKIVNSTKPLEDVRFISENETRLGVVLYRPKD